jgi:hypothetical protein
MFLRDILDLDNTYILGMQYSIYHFEQQRPFSCLEYKGWAQITPKRNGLSPEPVPITETHLLHIVF